MHNPTARETPALTFQASRHPPAFGPAGQPSFARALRQRGLIAPAHTAGDGRCDEADDAGEWMPVMATFEAHLRRWAMEHAFAELRGDAV